MDKYKQLKEQVSLHDYCDHYLIRRGQKFVCPNCGSGLHRNGTPAFSIMPGDKRFTCFSCGIKGDVFDLAGIVNGTSDKNVQCEAVASFARGSNSLFTGNSL